MRYFFLIVLFLPLACLAQKQLGKSKANLKKELKKLARKPGMSLTERKGNLVFSSTTKEIPDTVTFIYEFNEAGKCNSEKLSTRCKTCYEKYLQILLGRKDYQWKKMNENQYASKFEARLLLEVSPEDNQYYFTLFSIKWTREMYDMLLKN